MLCSFSGATGAVRCMRKGGIGAAVAICTACCREHRRKGAAGARLEVLAAKEMGKAAGGWGLCASGQCC